MKKTYVIATLIVTTLASFVQAVPNTSELTGDLAAVYLNQPTAVLAGNPIFIGCSLARPAVLKGEVDVAVAAGATTFTAYGTNVFDGLVLAGGTEAEPTSDNHWIIEFTSGAYTGLVKQVTAFSGSTVTVAGGLPVIDKGTRFVLRKDHTLGALFGNADLANLVTKSGLSSGSTSGSSDVVSVLNSAGQWVKYFYRAGTGWKLTTARTGSDRQHVRVSLGTGVPGCLRRQRRIRLFAGQSTLGACEVAGGRIIRASRSAHRGREECGGSQNAHCTAAGHGPAARSRVG